MTDIIPVVPYEDIRAAHDWLVKVLGFTSAGVIEDGSGTVIHGEVQLGDRRIWLHAAACWPVDPEPSERGRRVESSCWLTTSTPTSSTRKAAGATILSEPTDQDYGQREYGVKDPEGHSWWMATPFARASRQAREPPEGFIDRVACQILRHAEPRHDGGLCRVEARIGEYSRERFGLKVARHKAQRRLEALDRVLRYDGVSIRCIGGSSISNTTRSPNTSARRSANESRPAPNCTY